ncbi:T9SS type A sorting domain-containing protein [candidate division KSB1 bacterium]|nr:T9SS type A sorting domain-containing protein [candidate division KSB1 bacterium]
MKKLKAAGRILLVLLLVHFSTGFSADENHAIMDDDIKVDFNAGPTVGLAPLFVHFSNNSDNRETTYFWNFGDGTTSTKRNPVNRYDVPGVYHVTLKVYRRGDMVEKTIERLITVYDDSTYNGFCRLKVVECSHTYPKETWQNSIDGDTYLEDGTTTAGLDQGWCIYTFENEKPRFINKIRMLTDTKTKWLCHRVTKFKIYVSSKKTYPTDFVEILDVQRKVHDWETYQFEPVAAKYIKLVIEEPFEQWAQIGEFEVYETVPELDLRGSTLTTSSVCVADSLDSCRVMLDLADSAGKSVTGLNSSAFRLIVSGEKYSTSNFIETDVPGTYFTSFKSFYPGEKEVSVKVYGHEVKYSSSSDSSLAIVRFEEPISEFAPLVFVEGTTCYPEMGWDNLVDGDIEGNDGATFAGPRFEPAWGIFKFQDDKIKLINRLRFMTNTGEHPYTRDLATWYKIYVSTAGTGDNEFYRIHEAYKDGGDWEEFKFIPFYAKYIKIVLFQPSANYRMAGELEVYVNGVYGAQTLSAEFNELEKDVFNSDREGIPETFDILQNYPNPFNPETQITYTLPELAKIRIQIFNLLGQRVQLLVDAEQSVGVHKIYWNGKDYKNNDVVSGTYWCRFEATGKNSTFSKLIKMVLVR